MFTVPSVHSRDTADTCILRVDCPAHCKGRIDCTYCSLAYTDVRRLGGCQDRASFDLTGFRRARVGPLSGLKATCRRRTRPYCTTSLCSLWLATFADENCGEASSFDPPDSTANSLWHLDYFEEEKLSGLRQVARGNTTVDRGTHSPPLRPA